VHQTLTLLPTALAVCRLPPGSAAPPWLGAGPLCSITWTDAETSVVSPDADVPPTVRAERGWRAFRVEGPLDFALTGVLAGLTAPLAAAGVPVFALSTFDTDYLLVRVAAAERAAEALRSAGWPVR
jgi:hypothetical protein